ncbi:unnamed protein product [Leptosia nina]|uniref:Uncharacterized protein n=1 Tax=Leptosia nina TaxID=320188 RepID=A0AAV1JSZ3_9NEOP
MAKLQKADACALLWLFTRRGEHFHLTRLRGRRPSLAYSADLLQTNRNTTLSFLSSSSLALECEFALGSRLQDKSVRVEAVPTAGHAPALRHRPPRSPCPPLYVLPTLITNMPQENNT